MGRHTGGDEAAAGSARSSLSVIAMMIILALVLLGFAIRGFSAANSDEAVSDTSSRRTASAESTDADSTAGIPDMGEDNDPHTESAADEDAESQAAEDPTEEPAVSDESSDTSEPAAFQACRSEVAAGDDWTEATADSAAHWKRHYSASVAYNDGDITLQEAEKEFAASKANGAGDIEAVGSAKKSYEKAVGACDSMTVADLPDTLTEDAKDCAARADAMIDVVPTGTKVNEDWSAHLDMMKTKDDADPDEYHKRWRMMVDMAPDNMGPYERALTALDGAPRCP